jgi:NitT/TauT family transport system substrate-binding protein
MILAPDSFIAAHPDAVRAFVQATAAGWAAYLHGDPAPADAMIMKANPEQTADVLAQAREMMRNYGIVEPSGWGADKIGGMSDARWAETYRTAKELGLAPAGLDIHRAYTTLYAPNGQ